jgi:hypothetical protein
LTDPSYTAVEASSTISVQYGLGGYGSTPTPTPSKHSLPAGTIAWITILSLFGLAILTLIVVMTKRREAELNAQRVSTIQPKTASDKNTPVYQITPVPMPQQPVVYMLPHPAVPELQSTGVAELPTNFAYPTQYELPSDETRYELR